MNFFSDFFSEASKTGPQTSRIAAVALAAGLLSLILGASAQAEDAGSRRSRAIGLAEEGRCPAALEIFLELRAGAPGDPRVEQLTGECALRLQQFRLAEEALGQARAAAPETPLVDLHLAMAHFHQGEVDAAEAALGNVGAADHQEPEFLLYSGLVAMERRNFEEAAVLLEQAVNLGPTAPEPVASFYLARALAEVDRPEASDAAFARIVRDYPGTEWANQAAQARAAADAPPEKTFQYWASGELGFEHDDNVLLRGFSVVDTPRDPAANQRDRGQSDQRGYWFFDAGGLVDLTDEWRVGGLIRLSGTDHLEQSTFDSNTPGATVWVDRVLNASGLSARAQYDFDQTWVDKDPFLRTHLFTGSLFQPWEGWGYSAVSLAYERNDFGYQRFDVQDANPCPAAALLCGPVGINEEERTNRDGDGITARLFHSLPIEFESAFVSGFSLSGEYLYHRYWARGAEYDHQRHQIEVEMAAVLPLEIGLSVGGRYAYVPYDNNSIFPDPPVARIYTLPSRRRREQETGVWVRLERDLIENLTLAAHYRRTRNRSNTEVFDYDRNIFGLSLRFAIGS